MTCILNTKLGDHRGSKRLWIEGNKLARQGYLPGMKYDLELRDSQAVIVLTENGKFTVSRKERNGRIDPIISLTSKEMAELFDGVEKLRVLVRKKDIVITAHQQDVRILERENRLLGKLKTGSPLTVASLFHGGGVLDKAMHAGFKKSGIASAVGVVVEMEADYLESSLQNNPELFNDSSIVIESAIQDVALNKNPIQVDLLFAGIPCTGASKSGRTKNKLEFAESHSEAGALFFSFLEFVKALNPGVVVIENVPEYQNTASMEVIRSVLSTLGYVIQERVLGGNEFGALENRQRLSVVGVSKGIEGFDLSNVIPLQTKPETINDILEPVPLDSARWKAFDYLAEKEIRDKKAGKGFMRQLLTGSEAHCGTIGKAYAKCRSTEPFLVHPTNSLLSRLFTPLEHCRVKGIPESVINGLSDTIAHEVLGQSVVFPKFVALAYELGNKLQEWAAKTPMRLAKVVQLPVVPVNQGQLAMAV